jgi:hypothetical protein
MRALIACFALLILVPVVATAQTFSADEQEIIDLTHSCWEAWAAEDLSAIDRACNEHEDTRFWWTADAVPAIGWVAKNAQRWGEAFHPRTNLLYWEVRPVSVRIFRDVALIHFWATYTVVDENGQTTANSQKRLDIWQRVDSRWIKIGGMGTPEGD